MNLVLFFEGTGQGVAGAYTNVTRMRDLCVEDDAQRLHLESGPGTHFGAYAVGRVSGIGWRQILARARRWLVDAVSVRVPVDAKSVRVPVDAVSHRESVDAVSHRVREEDDPSIQTRRDSASTESGRFCLGETRRDSASTESGRFCLGETRRDSASTGLRNSASTRIFLFGFSRGALIARKFAEELNEKGIEVAYLGLWDTVDSTLNLDVSETCPKNVRAARHAVARDETRRFFALVPLVGAKSVRVPVDAKSVRVPVDAKSVRVPVDAVSHRVTEENDPSIQTRRDSASTDDGRSCLGETRRDSASTDDGCSCPEETRRDSASTGCTQLVFPGSHSDVGGLYADNHVIADAALAWIAAGAVKAGLRLKPGTKLRVRRDYAKAVLHSEAEEASNLWGAFDPVRRVLKGIRRHASCRVLSARACA